MIRPMSRESATMSKPIEEILAPKPEARPRIYAYSIDDKAHKGLLKVGQTTRDVKQRVAEQLKTAAIKNYTIELDESAERDDGTIFTDHEVRAALVRKRFENTELEWMRCSVKDVKTVLTELRTGQQFTGTHHETFPDAPRAGRGREQDARLLPLDLEGGHARRPALPLEREDALRQDLHHLPARQEARRQARARGDLQARGRGCVADGPRNPCGLRRLAVPLAQSPAAIRRRSTARSRSSISAPSRTCSAATTAGNIKPKNEWLHKVKWDLVVFDEYHFGAWRETAKELFEGEEEAVAKKEAKLEYAAGLEDVNEDLSVLSEKETEFLPITTKAYLYLSGTPFKALATGEFIEEQIFNWTYTDEQRAKEEFAAKNPGKWNPYGALPQMRLLTYQMPDELLAIASAGEFDEFDLNEFFAATGTGARRAVQAQERRAEVAGHHPRRIRAQGGREPQDGHAGRHFRIRTCACCRTSSTRSGSCRTSRPVTRWRTCWPRSTTSSGTTTTVVVAAGASAGIGLDALPPVRKAIGSGFETKTITLSCGKLTTGVTVPQWSSILMLRNLKSPETYFQAAFRVQSPWSIKNPNGDNPNEEEILKPVCFVFDFAPTRALRQLSEYGIGLSPNEPNPENAVKDLVSFLPVLAYDGANMTQIDAGGILDIAMAGTSATLLARKWESALLVNVDNDTLRRILDNPEAMAAVERIEGWRALGDNIIETIINKSEKVKELKNKAKDSDLTAKQKKQLTDEEKEYKSKRKLVQEKLIKFATRIPAFMYLTDFRENTLQDVITKLEPDLFLAVTGLTVKDFHLLVRLKVFNTEQMNQAVFAFRRYEDASLRYTGIESHEGLTHYGLYDTVVAVE